MPLQTDMPIVSAFSSISSLPRLFFPKLVHDISFSSDRASFIKLKSNSRCARRISVSLARESSSMNYRILDDGTSSKIKSSEFVDVIVLGSRKDAIIDCCLDSPSHTVPLRFWSVIMKSSSDVQLQQRVRDEDPTSEVVESSKLMESSPKAIILVASGGYGAEHSAAIEILSAIRSLNVFAVTIILKPFSFEGQKRLDGVQLLERKLQKHSDFCIDIDIESLLKNEMVTLDEALKAANSSVSLAINAISALVDDMHVKIVDGMDNKVKEMKSSEARRILGNYRKAKVGYGAGHNLKTSLLRAIYDCPFVYDGVKDVEAIVIGVSASSCVAENIDVQTVVHTLRQVSICTDEIMIYVIDKLNMEKNVQVTIFFVVGCSEQETFQRTGFFSGLAKNIPFLFNILNCAHTQTDDNEEDSKLRKAADSGNCGDAYDTSVVSLNETEAFESSVASHLLDGNVETEDYSAFQREAITSWDVGFNGQISKDWTQERADYTGVAPVLDSLSGPSLPVGVRPLESTKANLHDSAKDVESLAKGNFRMEAFSASNKSLKSFGDISPVILTDKYVEIPKKQGNLSLRAASMLEAERDQPKRWSPTLEMQYRGGVYQGRCQGGLPEGKGRLILGDGSIYDGMWHYGKRSGLGTFYFKNGDVFQGTWRDDAIHGKGWLYFHTGDRWFSNFWKGKANGEGRFYSKSGDVLFGHFKDGWRHGPFHCIYADGTRCMETWEDGVLLARRQVDNAAEE